MHRSCSIVFFLLVAPTIACGVDPFLGALPTRDDVEIRVPDNAGQALTLGERSELYEVTRNVSRGINGGILSLFVLMEAIVQHPPTVKEENLRVWGPSEPRGLEDVSYRFTVERTAEREFAYALEGKPKGADDDAFLVLFSGIARPGENDRGTGELALELDNARTLRPRECAGGRAEIRYDVSNPELRSVEVQFDVIDACGGEAPVPALYQYSEAADGAGTFLFEIHGNIHKNDEEKPLAETLTIRSRWLGSGAGRSDVVITGGEVLTDLEEHLPSSGATSVKATECWDAGFGLVHADTHPEELREIVRPLLGEEDACAIAEAVYPEPV